MSEKHRCLDFGPRFALILVAGGLAGACASEPEKEVFTLPQAVSPRQSAVTSHEAKKAAHWPIEGALEDRVRKAPQELIEYLRLDNENQGWPERPSAVSLEEEPARSIAVELKEVLKELPECVRALVASKLVGVFLVRDLGGSASTDQVLDEKANPTAGFIALDVTMLNRTANEWATMKESSPFEFRKGWALRARIADAKDDTRKSALRYILLHELGHVVAIGRADLLADWSLAAGEVKSLDRFTFSRLSWNVDGERFVSRFDHQFPFRSRVHYYASQEKRLPIDVASELYADLEKTNFVTLYAATSKEDDFAESFVSYVHTQLLKKPWSIEITQDRRLLRKSLPCWNTPRCSDKSQAIAGVLGLNGGENP